MEGEGLELDVGSMSLTESLNLVDKWLDERCYAISLMKLNLLGKYHIGGNGNGNGKGNNLGEHEIYQKFLDLKLRAYEIGIGEEEKAIARYEKRYLPNPNNKKRCQDNIKKYKSYIAETKEKIRTMIQPRTQSVESKINSMIQVKVGV